MGRLCSYGMMVLLVGLAGLPVPGGAAATVHATLESHMVHIGALYNGAKVSISGELPAECDALIRVTGKPETLNLKRKGRALGLFWMNLDNVTFRQVPTVYLLFSSKNLEIAGRSNPISLAVPSVDLDSLEGHIEGTYPLKEKHLLFLELLKLKMDEGLYAVQTDAVHYTQTEGPMKSFTANVKIPSRLKPGTYTVDVFAIDQGRIVGTASENLTVDEVGLPAFLANLAFQHGGLYGVLATLVAVVAGLLTGLLFRESKGGH